MPLCISTFNLLNHKNTIMAFTWSKGTTIKCNYCRKFGIQITASVRARKFRGALKEKYGAAISCSDDEFLLYLKEVSNLDNGHED